MIKGQRLLIGQLSSTKRAEEYVPELTLKEINSITAECIKYGGEHHTAILELLRNIWKTITLPNEWNDGKN